MAENIVKGGYADVGNLLDAGGDNCCSRWGRCSGNQECIDCKCQYRDDDSRLPSFDDSQSPSQPYIVNVPSSGVIGGQPVSLGFSGFEVSGICNIFFTEILKSVNIFVIFDKTPGISSVIILR